MSVARRLASVVAVAMLVTTPRLAAALCYQHPLSHVQITSPYNEPRETSYGYHRGTDYGGVARGTAVMAVADGQVVTSTWDWCQGNVVVVAHPDGMFSSYSHLAPGTAAGVGTVVGRGATVGGVGDTGDCAEGPHVHLVIANHAYGYNSRPEVDPYQWIQDHIVCNQTPSGSLDAVDATTLRGWAFDPDAPKQAIAVHVYVGGPAGNASAYALPLNADVSRPDLCGALGSCEHGFTRKTPRSFLDGQPHPIHAYGIDSVGGPNAELTNSPRTLLAAPPALSPSTTLRRVPNDGAFGAWRFSKVEDVAPLPGGGAKFSQPTNALGPDLEATPRAVRSADNPDSVWMVDHGVRRAVDPKAWRLVEIETLPTPVLMQIPQGPPFPDEPLLVADTGPTYFVLDEAFAPLVGDPQGAAGASASASAGSSSASAGFGGAVAGSAGAGGVARTGDPLAPSATRAAVPADSAGCSLRASARGSAAPLLLAVVGASLAGRRPRRRAHG